MKFKKGDIVIDKDGNSGVILDVDNIEQPNFEVIWIDKDGNMLFRDSFWYYEEDLKPHQLKNIPKKNALVLALLFDVKFEEFKLINESLRIKHTHGLLCCDNLVNNTFNTKKNKKNITIEISEESYNELKEKLKKLEERYES